MEFEYEIDGLMESIKKFGNILESNKHIFNFIFKEGTYYAVTNEGKIATRNEEKGFDCILMEY